MNIIKKKLIDKINKYQDGIPLDQYIQICLFDEKGYYNQYQPIGQTSDFITSPEISQLFGEIVGLYIYNLWTNHFNCDFNLIELGPGKGTLMSDILRINNNFKGFINSINLDLIELNKKLIRSQKEKLLGQFINNNKIKWHNNFKSLKAKPSVIIANEFFDCFPTKQYIKIDGNWNEKKIKFNDKEDSFYIKNSIIKNSSLRNQLDKNTSNNKEFFEISTSREKYYNNICQFIKKNSGVLIIIDYGYFAPRNYPSIQSIKYHHNTRILDNPGTQDITSLVDFQKFKEIAIENKLNFYGPLTQRDFLLINGITERKKRIFLNANQKQKKDIEEGYLRLITKKGMGTIFKFIIVSNFKINNAK